jgi:hypothetical protein
MKQSTLNALVRTVEGLQDLAEELYFEFQRAFDNEDYLDASLLQSRADKLYEEVISIETVLLELEEE